MERLGTKKEKIGIAGYIWLLVAILFFSGAFREAPGVWKLLDLSTYTGTFGTVIEGATAGFVGKGGTGMNNMFANILTIAPGIMFCVGLLEVVERYGGMKAAERLLSPIMKFLMGVPGEASLVMIANLQSSDTSVAMIKAMRDNGNIDDKGQKILLAYCMPGPALIGMMITYGVIVYPYMSCSSGIVILVVILMKIVVSEIMRFFFAGSSGKKVKREG